jgi:hypothetical protein
VPKNVFCPDHWGGLFGPKLCEPSTYVNFIMVCIEKVTFPDIYLVDPLWEFTTQMITLYGNVADASAVLCTALDVLN